MDNVSEKEKKMKTFKALFSVLLFIALMVIMSSLAGPV